MAKNRKSTKEQSSQYPSSPEFFGMRLERNLVRIPNDQRKLLDRPDSWAEFLSTRPKRFLNVPPEVLENLKECHARQQQTTQPENNKTPHSPQPDPNTDHDDDDDDEDDEFSSSPEANKFPPQKAPDKEAQQLFITQLPPISSPQPTMPALTKRPPLPPCPPSEQEEEPLDVKVPTAIPNDAPLINASAVPIFATPPSAQIVPCTFQLSELSSTEQEVKSKQRKYNPVCEFYRPQKQPTPTYRNYNVANMGRKDSPQTDIQSSMSTASMSSSIIPSTIPCQASVSGFLTQPIDQPISPSEVSRIRPEGPNTQHSPKVQQRSPEYRPRSPELGSLPTITLAPQTTAVIATEKISESQAPFIQYSVTYPAYNGSVRDFVTAGMYIQLQQRRIRTSLYDDFIRAWHEGYVTYVRDCDGSEPPVKPLNAIEWYNSVDDDPIFTSRVVTRQNLQSCLDYYPDELHFARTLLGISPSQPQEVTSTPDAALLVEGRDLKNTVATNIGLSRVSPIISNPEIAKGDPMDISPPSTPPLPPQESKIAVSLHKSLSEIERKPTTNNNFARSFSDASHQKRKASEELGGTLSKRASINSLARPDSKSNASVISHVPKSTREGSVAPSSTGRRKQKYIDDPKKRNEAFMKYLKKKKLNDSIASSAPTGSTPTSAQRE
ncbi:hypothetical protein F4804DRAFT_133881 [Jackrogersella minutella]|nr:hypothetical protein F4804DRAFT_133881 [Jackrogersella minutella]